MKFTKLFILLLVGFIPSLSIFGQVIEPPNWEVSIAKENPKIGDTVVISFKVEIPEDWYLYSNDFDPFQKN